MHGRFITFEGGEGTGKSTQARLLADRLETAGLSVLMTREPGGSAGAEIIRHVLLSGAAKPFGPDAEAMLFAAARADHVRTVIEPALAQGRWVVCDRFIDSTRVYQGTLGKVDRRIVRRLERIAVGDTMPDLTIILDVPAQTGLARASRRRGKGRPDRFENEALAFHAALREAYREIAVRDKQRCVLVDAQGGEDEIAQAIWRIVEARLDPEHAVALGEAGA